MENRMNKVTKERIRKIAKKIKLIELSGGKCETCGDTRFYCMHFHHKDGSDKEFTFTGNFTKRESELLKELEKCQILCGNCHQRYHADNKNNSLKRIICKKTLMKYKNVTCCEKCKEESDVRILSFHHLRDKLFEICLIINNKTFSKIEDIPQDIKDEVDKCVILCPNCHMEEHFDKEFFETYKDLILEKSNNIKEIQEKLDRDEIYKLYKSGITQIEIARMFNASKGTINGILKSFGLTNSLESIKIDEEKVLALHTEGLSNPQISEELGVHRGTILAILKKHNLEGNKNPESRKNQRKFDPTKEELIEHLIQEKSLREIGDIYNVSYVAVIHLLKKLNINRKEIKCNNKKPNKE